MRQNNYSIGSTVQHEVTGSVGMVLDTVREIDETRFQYLVQWQDDLSLERSSWELRQDLFLVVNTNGARN
jgi:heat shock protein HspQ